MDYITFLRALLSILYSAIRSAPKWLPKVTRLFADLVEIRTLGLRYIIGWRWAGIEFWFDDWRNWRN